MKGLTPAATMARASWTRMRERAPTVRLTSRTPASGDLPNVISAQMFRNPRQDHRFVGRGDRAMGGGGKQGGFLVGDLLERAETLAVFEIDVQDHRHIGPNDLRQFWNFAARVGAAFENSRAMLFGKRENRHRHADQIVQIAGSGERGSEQGANGGCGEFLGGGLAGRAADCDQRKRRPRVSA